MSVEDDSGAGKNRIETGVEGFDVICDGGLPAQGVTVVLGGPGSGKTLFCVQVLATHRVPLPAASVFVAFEESAACILENTKAFRWGADDRAAIHFVDAQLADSVLLAGQFDLIGLLASVAAKATAIAAKVVVFDGIDVLLSYLDDPALIRREIFRLRAWAYKCGLSVLLTAKADEANAGPQPRYEFLQYIADCLVTLSHRVSQGTALRFLRVAKFRGAAHSANEFPFTITNRGIEITALALREVTYPASTERISTGIERLDSMLSGGYYRGSSVLITGAPGTAKTSLAAAFTLAATRRNERTLYISFDESPEQIIRNVASLGFDLRTPLKAGVLMIHSARARAENPETHVARMRALTREFKPRNLIIDPLSALEQRGCTADSEAAALEVLDFAKNAGITILSTSLLGSSSPLTEQTPLNISTIADTWMHLSYVSQAGERNRALTIIKARGTGHSNQVRELVLTNAGVSLADVYASEGEVLMGTLRWEKENDERRLRLAAQQRAELRQQKAAIALQETKSQMETLSRMRVIQEAELEQIRADGTVQADLEQLLTEEKRRLRRADALDPAANDGHGPKHD